VHSSASTARWLRRVRISVADDRCGRRIDYLAHWGELGCRLLEP
jgi:hypothetical protein